MIIKNFATQKDALDDMRKDVDKALKAVSEKYGITLKAGNISYSDYELTLKVKAKIESEEAATKKTDHELSIWNMACKCDTGIEQNWFGKSFFIDGKMLKVVGYNPRSRKAPIELQDQAGKMYKSSVSMVSYNLNTQGATK